MGIPVYVTNWKKLIDGMQDKIQVNLNGDFNFDFGPIEDVLNQYFPDILEILKALAEQTKKTGMQQIKGQSQQIYSAGTHTFIFRPESDILLTGLTYAQSRYGCDESYDLIVTSPDGVSIKLFDKVPVKDTLQQKLLARFFPVPAGCTIKVVLHAAEGGKTGWVDFEYLNLEEPTETGTVIVRYMVKGSRDVIVLGQETKTLPYGLHTVGNIKNFAGYAQKNPTARNVYLSAAEPTKIIAFWYEQTGGIAHDYDIKFTLRWDSNSSCDLDLHGYLDHNRETGVWFRQTQYSESETDKLWLDFDYTMHGPNGYETEPEILTVLGCRDKTLSIQIENFNRGNLRTDPVLELSTADGELLESVTISKKLLGLASAYMVWVCDISLSTRTISKKVTAIESMGTF